MSGTDLVPVPVLEVWQVLWQQGSHKLKAERRVDE